MKTDLFQSCGHCWVFQICWHIDCSTFTASSFKIWNSSTGIPSPPPALFVVMLPKAYLTSHSRMSGSRWVITPSWLCGSWRSFLYSSSVYFCHLFLIPSASVRSIHDSWEWVNEWEGKARRNILQTYFVKSFPTSLARLNFEISGGKDEMKRQMSHFKSFPQWLISEVGFSPFQKQNQCHLSWKQSFSPLLLQPNPFFSAREEPEKETNQQLPLWPWWGHRAKQVGGSLKGMKRRVLLLYLGGPSVINHACPSSF